MNNDGRPTDRKRGGNAMGYALSVPQRSAWGAHKSLEKTMIRDHNDIYVLFVLNKSGKEPIKALGKKLRKRVRCALIFAEMGMNGCARSGAFMAALPAIRSARDARTAPGRTSRH